MQGNLHIDQGLEPEGAYSDVRRAMVTAKVLQHLLGVNPQDGVPFQPPPNNPYVSAWLNAVALMDTSRSSSVFIDSVLAEGGVCLPSAASPARQPVSVFGTHSECLSRNYICMDLQLLLFHGREI